MLLERMIRAARLDVNLYEEVEHDLNATSQAATVVGIVALCGGLGTGIAVAMTSGTGAAIGGFIGGIFQAYIGWVAWAYITFWVGTSLFKAQATPGEMLRTIGFAQTPAILGIFVFVPFIGWLVALIGGIWSIVAAVIGLRQGLDISTGQAIITAIIGFIPLLLIGCVLGLITQGGSALLGG
jgi:hypothetical protein